LLVFAFLPFLFAHNYYYALPAMVFGPSLFPPSRFGLNPTSGGYALGALFYAVVAFALSFPVAWLVGVRTRHDPDGTMKRTR